MTQADDTTRSVILKSDRVFENHDSTRHSPRCRNWFITSFDKSDLPKRMPKMKYFLQCEDTSKPEHGSKWHMHALICFANAISFNTVKKMYANAHIEQVKNVFDVIGYIKNNLNGRKFNVISEGNEPKDTRFVKDLKEITNPDELDWKQYNTWRKIHEADEIDIEDMHKDVKVYYISGPSGSGKTERAKQIIRDNVKRYGSKLSMVKHTNGFWLNVGSNRKIALYDDFRDSHMTASEFINFIDYNKHPMNMKGTSCTNDYELIIITSVQALETIYSNLTGEPRQQWIRRIEEIQMTNDDDDDEIDIDALMG